MTNTISLSIMISVWRVCIWSLGGAQTPYNITDFKYLDLSPHCSYTEQCKEDIASTVSKQMCNITVCSMNIVLWNSKDFS